MFSNLMLSPNVNFLPKTLKCGKKNLGVIQLPKKNLGALKERGAHNTFNLKTTLPKISSNLRMTKLD